MNEPHMNALGQPVGQFVANWSPPPAPSGVPLDGRFCRLLPLDPGAHAAPLHAAYSEDTEGRNWTYLPYGPFSGVSDYRAFLERTATGADPLFFTVCDGSDTPSGVASYLRITPAAGTIEVGHIHFAPCLQRTSAATEAIFLMMRCAFALGYRRLEWKCDALNAASRRAAERLGFTYEGTHRQAAVVKGRNRDTAWYSILDHEWSRLEPRYESWLVQADRPGCPRLGEVLSKARA